MLNQLESLPTGRALRSFFRKIPARLMMLLLLTRKSTVPSSINHAEESRLQKAMKARDEELQGLRALCNARRQLRHEKLLPHLPHFGDHLTPAVLLSMNTGLRRGEVLKLR
jgi:hypothetical protein